MTGIIDAVSLKDCLCEIKTNGGDRHGNPPLWQKNAAIFAEGKGAVHAIKWAVQRPRYMTLETISLMSDDPLISLPAVAR